MSAFEFPALAITPIVLARVTHNTTQSINSGSWTAAAMNTDTEDPFSMHDTVTNNSRITIPAGYSGRYDIKAWAEFVADATGKRFISIAVNGSRIREQGPFIPDGTYTTRMFTAADYPLSAGDYVELHVFQDKGSAINLGANPSLTITRIGGTQGGDTAGVQIGTTVGGLTAFNGATALLRTGSSPYEFIALVYDSTYGKWISPVYEGTRMEEDASNNGITETGTSYANKGTPAIRHIVPNVKALYDAGLRMQVFLTAYMKNSGANNTFAQIAVREVADGDTGGSDIWTGAEVIHNGTTQTIKMSGWVTLTHTTVPTDAHAYIQLQTKVAAGTGQIALAHSRYRWINA